MEGYRFSTELAVRFAETDAQGIAHHASFVVWLEVALAGVAGAFVGLIVAALTVPQGRLVVDLSAMLLGALAGIGIERYARG